MSELKGFIDVPTGAGGTALVRVGAITSATCLPNAKTVSVTLADCEEPLEVALSYPQFIALIIHSQ